MDTVRAHCMLAFMDYSYQSVQVLTYTQIGKCMLSMHAYLLPACVSVQVCVYVGTSPSSCRHFISLLQLGEATQFGVHCDSYNLTNWDGGGFGLNLS